MAYIPNRAYAAIIQNRDALEAIAGLRHATGTITFAANATNGKILTLYGKNFEFLTDVKTVTTGNHAVQIAADDTEATRNNLLAVILSVFGLAKIESLVLLHPPVIATTPTGDGVAAGFGASLSYYELGTIGNASMTCNDDNIAVTGMSGGVDGGVINPSTAENQATLNAAIGTTSEPAAGTVNKQLADIKSNTDKIPAKGQAEASASTPVVLPATQITALTPPAAITGFATELTTAALLTNRRPVPVGTALHSTAATSGAQVTLTCPAGTLYIEGWSGSDFYYKRATGVANTDNYHGAGRFIIEWYCAAESILSILVTSGAATRVDGQAMGVA